MDSDGHPPLHFIPPTKPWNSQPFDGLFFSCGHTTVFIVKNCLFQLKQVQCFIIIILFLWIFCSSPSCNHFRYCPKAWGPES